MSAEKVKTTPEQKLLGRQIGSFDSLIGLHAGGREIRAFKTLDQIIVLRGMTDSSAIDSGFNVVFLDSSADLTQFLGQKIWPDSCFGITVFGRGETQDRRVIIYTSRSATIKLNGVELPVRPYRHRPDKKHFEYQLVITDDTKAAEFMENLRRQIETAEEIILNEGAE